MRKEGFAVMRSQGGLALMPLERLWSLDERQQVALQLFECFLDVAGRYEEKLAVRVDEVDAPVRKSLVQSSLNSHRIIAEEDRVNVESKRHRRVPEFPDSVHGVEPSRHSNLHNAAAERPDV